jgi:uncharacterized membrane protein
MVTESNYVAAQVVLSGISFTYATAFMIVFSIMHVATIISHLKLLYMYSNLIFWLCLLQVDASGICHSCVIDFFFFIQDLLCSEQNECSSF